MGIMGVKKKNCIFFIDALENLVYGASIKANTGDAFMIIQPDDLTPAERLELELAYDSEIPPQAIADKIRMRDTRPESVKLNEELRRWVDAAADHLHVCMIYKMQAKDNLADMENTQAIWCLSNADEVEARIDALEPKQVAAE